jgi:hypothetical protein
MIVWPLDDTDVRNALHLQSLQHQQVSVEDFAAAEPDVLRHAAVELINAWNR